MARFLVFAAWTPEDAVLWNSLWMAEQTIRLAARAEAVAVRGADAVRGTLESTLADSTLEGVALFGHGLPHAVMGSDGVVRRGLPDMLSQVGLTSSRCRFAVRDRPRLRHGPVGGGAIPGGSK